MRRLRKLTEIPDYSIYNEEDEEAGESAALHPDTEEECKEDDDSEFSPTSEAKFYKKPKVLRRRFLPKGKRSFYRGNCNNYW